MYRSSACWGFASVTDRQKLKAFIRRSIRAGFYTPDPDYDFEQLCNLSRSSAVQHDFKVSVPCIGTTVATRCFTQL